MPFFQVNTVFIQDRLGRGGDHTPFQLEGYAAVRISTPNEIYANQHHATDLLENMSVPYTAKVARFNGVVAASLALAPKAPLVTRAPGAGAGRGRGGNATDGAASEPPGAAGAGAAAGTLPRARHPPMQPEAAAAAGRAGTLPKGRRRRRRWIRRTRWAWGQGGQAPGGRGRGPMVSRGAGYDAVLQMARPTDRRRASRATPYWYGPPPRPTGSRRFTSAR